MIDSEPNPNIDGSGKSAYVANGLIGRAEVIAKPDDISPDSGGDGSA